MKSLPDPTESSEVQTVPQPDCFVQKQGHKVIGSKRGITFQALHTPTQGRRVGHWQPTPPAAGRWQRGSERVPTASVTRNVGHLEGLSRGVEM